MCLSPLCSGLPSRALTFQVHVGVGDVAEVFKVCTQDTVSQRRWVSRSRTFQFRPDFLQRKGSRTPSSSSRTAEGAFGGVFRTFPGVKNVRGPAASAEITWQVIFHLPESSRAPAHGLRRLMARALCRSTMMARRTSSKTATRRIRKSWRCSTGPSTGSNSLAGVSDASAVTTWQAPVQAGGAARSRIASKSFTRLPFLERIVDVPVLQITDELLNEADTAVRGSREGAGGKSEGGGG